MRMLAGIAGMVLAATAAVAAEEASAPAEAPAAESAAESAKAQEAAPAKAEAASALSDVEVWNKGVDFYRAGDATNALETLRPLLSSRTHGPRAAELVAKLALDAARAGGPDALKYTEEAADAAQRALRASPGDPRAERNFTRAADRLPEMRANAHVAEVLRKAQGSNPGDLMLAATHEARRLMTESGAYRTNAAARAVALADALAARAERLADAWLPVREAICQSVTNEEQAATILAQLEQARAKTKTAARALGDMDDAAYPALSDAEHDFTRFLKLTVLPPAAVGEGLVAQSNAWQDVDAFNGRSWQADALDYTRAFRAKFPAWAKAYEQQAQADTNRPPFTAEDQAKVSALATQVEKLQIACAEKPVPPQQEEALALLRKIQELLPKDGRSGGQGSQQQQQNPPQGQQKQDPQQQKQDAGQDAPQDQRQEQNPEQAPKDEQGEEKEPSEEQQQLEAVLKKAQERSDEHEAEKKARMRKAPLPPNARDW